MKKLFLLFALVLTAGMNAWAADYVATDYLNENSHTYIEKMPTLTDPSMCIHIFQRNPENGKVCVTWGGYENKDANILPKILIDGVDFAQPGWELCWLNNNPDNDVDTWWDAKDSDCHIYTKEINGVTWTLRFYNPRKMHECYYVYMYFCPSEIEGGSKHTITVKGRLTEYVAKNTPSTTNYLDVERTFEFDAAKLITSDPIVFKENTNELSFYGNLAEGAEKSTYFGLYVNDGTVNGFVPYDQLDGKQELPYATTFSNIKYTIPEEFEGKDLRGQMHRDFTGLLGGKVSVCHYYDRFNAAANATHYLCFTANTTSSRVSLSKVGSPADVDLEYSKDVFVWQPYTLGEEISLSPGASVYFRNPSRTPTGFSAGSANYYHFSVEGDVAASGNIMTLVEKTGFITEMPDDYLGLFYGLFSGCTGLTAAPELPATTLTRKCYMEMFSGCTNLVSAPELPATTLANYCYNGMFSGCTSLTSAPELPATTLANYCYEEMFKDCSSLNYIKVGFTQWHENATRDWVSGVAAKGVFEAPVELDKTKTGTSKIPAGWTQAIFHPKSEPTYRTLGYNQDCWEVPGTGKYYSDNLCTQELANARLLRYAKLRSNPITYLEECGSSAENKTYEGVPFNWVAGGPFERGEGLEGVKRHAEFTVIGTDVADARLKLYSSVAFTCFYYIRIFVNGTEKYKETYGNTDPENFEERKSKAYIDAYPLEGLKTGDVVCLEVEKQDDGLGGWSYFDACLEYTSSNGGGINITVRADEKYKAYGTTQDPELTYSVLKSGEAADINLSGINLIREKGEELGEYAIHISQDEGANQEYYITFVDGKFRILDVEHRTITAPEYTTTGYSQECWEDPATGKFYTYDINMQELSPAQVITYKKLISNPVTANNGFTLKDVTYSGIQFDWAAETTYGSLDTGTRYVEFTAYGADVANARLKWRKTYSDARYGIFNITVYVNGKQVYRIQNYGGADLFAVPLQGLKTGDIVRFEVLESSQQWKGSPTITACLEYTSSNGGFNSTITITADDKYKYIGQSDPELTWKITNGALMEGDELTDINIWREEGEDAGRYPIHVSQKEGANPKYYIRFVDGTFTVNEVVHHEVTEPTHRTIGYSKECWEDMVTGKFYSDAECTQELSPAQVITYEKLISNPVTANSGFTLKDVEYDGVQFNWAAETIYNTYDKETRSVEFTVFGTDVANARLKWTKTSADYQYGKFTITVYVNGERKYSVNQNNGASLGGLFAVPLPDLQFGDNVKFEVQKPKNSSWAGSVTIAACLEYTSSNGCGIVIKADDIQKQKGDGDPELTWKITKGALMEGDELTDINIWREEGEDAGRYPIHVSQKEGANPKYGIMFLDGTFAVNEVVHHEVAEPTHRTIGYSKECWEDIIPGKFYSDAECTQGLSSAEAVTYKRLISNPVTTNSGFTLKDVEYNGVQFNWAAETSYNTSDTGTRSVEFTVFGTDVDNARVKWTKTYHDPRYGSFTINVYVNGTQVYSINQGDNALGGLSVIPLPDLKSGDKVKFEVNKPNRAQWTGAKPTITACLEYTSSNGGKGVGKYNYNVVVKAVDKQKFIGETDPELTYTVYPENIELSGINLTRDEGEEAGEYVIRISEDEGANPGYDITLAEGKFTISNSSIITIKADDKVKHVGDAGPELTWSVKGKLIEGHDLTDIIISREKGEEAGTYSIYASQANGANPYYDITFEDGTLVIADTDLPIYHGAAEPTYRTFGYTQNCWEDPATGKIYSDVLFEHELNPAEIVTYKKLISNPVTANVGFTLKDATYDGVHFDWAAETVYEWNHVDFRTVDFVVLDKDVENARLKWMKTHASRDYGEFYITVFVNGVQVYSIDQRDGKPLAGMFTVPLKGLRTGDVVRFQVKKDYNAWDAQVMIAACLEYTNSNGGAGVILTADDKLKNKGDDDPELTWQITGGSLAKGDELTGIKIWREEGEEIGSYTIHVSQEEGANPKYNITFVEGTFRISDIIHHEAVEPKYETVGNVEYWEDSTTGKYYSDAACTKELSPAQVFTYKKLITNPVTANNGFTLKDVTYSGIQFDWAAETTFTVLNTTIRYVEFTVFGTDVDNARLKWRKTYSDARYGTFDIAVYVNGKQVYRIQNYGGADLFAVPLQGLKTGDIVRFEVHEKSQEWAGSPTITACLEYTSSNGGLNGMLITANQDPDHTENYYSTFWSSTAAYQVPEGVTAYTGKVEDSTSEPNTSVLKLTAIEDGIIPASQGVILKLTTNDNTETQKQFVITLTTKAGTWSGTNALTGTDEATTLGATDYALTLGKNGVGFYNWNGRALGAHKAYLTLSGSQPAPLRSFGFRFDDGTTTGIPATIFDQPQDDAIYNLQGQRVDESYKGLIIKNGQKVYNY